MIRLLLPLLLLGVPIYCKLESSIGQLGQPCDPHPDHSPCTVNNSICVKGKCACNQGMIESSGGCIPSSSSQSCSPPCHPTKEICHQRQCLCAGGYVRIENNCQSAYLLSPSSSSSSSIRRSPQYLPYPGQSPLRTSPNAISAVPPDSVCGSDADCAGYPLAFCDGICRCVSGALNAGSTCISSGNSITSAGTCPPGQTYVTEAGSCMTTATPGEPCQYSQQCSALEAGAFCLRLKCECVYGMKQSGSGCTFADSNCSKRGFIWIAELGECKEVIPPGGRGCSHSLQCGASFAGSNCFLQTCTCPNSYPVAIDGTCGRNCTAGMTYSGVTGQCLPTVQPGDQCLYSSQCHAVHPGIGCDRGRCRCPRDEVFTGTGCAMSCSPGYRANSRGICAPGCRSNQVEHEGECLDASVPGRACVVNAQCTGGSSCQDSICKCTRGTTAKGGLCVVIESSPLGSCANGEICGGGSFCSNGNCTCPIGRQVLNGRCITPITVPPNSPCTSTVQCGGGSECVSNVCECPFNQISLNDICQPPPSVPAGGSCPSGFERCLGQSICVDGVCTCPSGTVADNGICLAMKQALPGANCNAASKCLHLSVCIDGVCQCPAGTSIDDGYCRASTSVSPGSDCSNGQICSGGSLCIANRCTCPPGTQSRDGQCQRLISVKPGNACHKGEICTGGSNCVSGMCACPMGTVNVQGYCQTSSGSLGSCETSNQCTGGSYCDTARKQCTCPVGKIAVGSVCIALSGTGNEVNLKSRDYDTCTFDQDCPKDRVCVLKRCECLFGEDESGDCYSSSSPFSNRLILAHRRVPIDAFNSLPQIKKSSKPSTFLSPTFGSSTHLKPITTIDNQSKKVNGYPSSIQSSNLLRPIILSNQPNESIGMNNNKNELHRSPIKVSSGANCLRSGVVCGGNSLCVRGICQCREGHESFDGVCMQQLTAEAGESCARGESCQGDTICNSISRICECRNPMEISIGHRCTPRLQSHPGYPCGNGEVCIGGSTCRRGRCECPNGSELNNKQCQQMRYVRPGDSCSNGEICEGGSSCLPTINRCTCSMGMQIVNGICERVVDVRPGGRCGGSNERCSGGSFCDNNNVCSCPQGTHQLAGYCRNSPVPQPLVTSNSIVSAGEECDSSSTCSDGTMCIRGICQCPHGLSSDGRCIRTTSTTTITPPPTLIPVTQSRPGNRRMISAGGVCSLSDLCTGRSFCLNGMCRCSPPLIPRGGQCLPESSSQVSSPSIGSSCRSINDCPSSSLCTNGFCVCPPGTSRSSTTRCVSTTTSSTTTTTTRSVPSTTTTTPSPSTTVASPFIQSCVRQSQPCLSSRIQCSNCGCKEGYRLIGPSHCIRVVTGVPFISQVSPYSNGIVYAPGTQVPAPTGLLGSLALSSSMEEFPTLVTAPMMESPPPQTINKDFPVPHIPPSIVPQSWIPLNPSTWFHGNPPPMYNRTPNQSINNENNDIRPRFNSYSRRNLAKKGWTSPPGEMCTSSIFCDGGSYCASGFCVCPPGQRSYSGRCQPPPIVPPGSYCVNGEVCSGNSHCVGGYCFCPSEHALKDGKCVKDEGEDEKNNGDYHTEMRMNNDLKDMIRLRRRKEDMRMKKIMRTQPEIQLAQLGESCIHSSILCTHGSHCVSGRCECPPGHRPLNGTCIPIGRRCLAVNQCPSGADCVNGECKCTQGLTLSRFGFCIPVTYVDPGMECPQGTQCRGGSSCAYGKCECPQEHEIKDHKCTPKDVQPRRRRLTSSNDLLFVPNKLIEKKEKKHRDISQRLLSPGESCDESVHCEINAYCTEERLCRCSPTFVQASRQCIPRDYVSSRIVSPGTMCSQTDFCDGGSVCLQGFCVCPQGFNPSPIGVCSPTQVGPGESCSEGERCSRGSICIGGQCICPIDMYEKYGHCVHKQSTEKMTFQKIAKSPGVPCDSNPTACTGGSLCIFGFCKCPIGTVNVVGVCTNSANAEYSEAGGSCSSGQTCAGNSICVSGFCVCPGGEKIRDGQCLSVDSQASPGQMCDPIITICSGNAICQNNVCTCPSNMVALNGQCANVLAQVNVGTGSSSSCPSPCPPNSFCQSGACICHPGYTYQQGQGCITSTSLFPSFVNPIEVQPIVQPSINIPSLIQPTILQPTNPQLQPPGSFCGSTAQCGSYSICQENVCRCLPGYSSFSTTGGCNALQDTSGGTITISGTVYVPTQVGFDGTNSILSPLTSGSGMNNRIYNANLGAPGQECDFISTPSCRGGASCQNGRCLCGNGLVIGQESCVPYSGDANPGESCTVPGVVCRGGSTCIDSICRCDYGYSPHGSICVIGGGGGNGGLPPITEPGLIVTLPPGEQCDPSCDYIPCPAKCGYGSVCVDTICTCTLGTVNMGSFCGAPEPPLLPTPPPTVVTTQTSIQTARPGDRCDVRIICNGGSQCILGICQCPQGYVPSGDRSSCVLASLLTVGSNIPQTFSSYSTLGNACLSTGDCPDGSSCVDRVCTCNADAKASDGKCVIGRMKNEAMVFPGSRCASETSCTKGSHCFLGYCVCLSDTTTNSTGFCEQRSKINLLPRALPGGQCHNGERCENGSNCVSGYCICRGDERSNEDAYCRGEIGEISKPGFTCSSSSDCSSIPNSICTQGNCVCDGGYERVNDSCIKVSSISPKLLTKKITKCSSYKDCEMPRVCGSTKTCDCPFTMTETDNGQCIYRASLAPPGSPCPIGSECSSGSQCISGVCVCPEGLVLTNDRCLPIPNAPGGSCSQNPDCSGGSKCMGGTCLCTSGFTKPGVACKSKREIKEQGLMLAPVSRQYDPRSSSSSTQLTECPSNGSCQLPSCYCSNSGTSPPSSLLPSQTPQMVVITFEGPVTDRTTRVYKSLFSGRIRFHECPLKATFFVSHEYNNYDQVQWLYARGHEIGITGMSSSSLASRSMDRWQLELQGMRMTLREFSRIGTDMIKGIRAPQMKTGGDSHFATLASWNFTYDHSISPNGGPFWPQTLDHSLPYSCTDGACPTQSIKGIWEVPVNRIITGDGRAVSRMRDAIRSHDTRNSVYEMLRRNFARNYQGSRAPFILNLDAEFLFSLPQNEAVNGLVDFLEEIMDKDDVFPVTVSQLISWMKSPTPIDRILKFKPWHCSRRQLDQVQPCETPSTCSFITSSGSRSFRVCGSCPKEYPTIDNPLGKGHR